MGARRCQAKAPSAATGTADRPCTKPLFVSSRIHGVAITPTPKPLVAPDTMMARLVREPLITIEGATRGLGTTALEGVDHADQPAPVRARTWKVYVEPSLRPPTVQAVEEERHDPLPGEDATW